MGNIKIVNGGPTRISGSDRHRLLLSEKPSQVWLAALHEIAQSSPEGRSLRFEYEGGSSLIFTSPLESLRENMILVNEIIRTANLKTDP